MMSQEDIPILFAITLQRICSMNLFNAYLKTKEGKKFL